MEITGLQAAPFELDSYLRAGERLNIHVTGLLNFLDGKSEGGAAEADQSG